MDIAQKRYTRRTAKYRGVKVRYSHLVLIENDLEYTTTEIDERNMESINRAYTKHIVNKSRQ